ncbi:MAG: FAD-binding oxidoreductase [Rhodoferax sp.]|uniref:NAD(P)/FAD-dependent oxidoreductase n=1 Tax=Rhodoferax sp. TaxID=50421 RepID=UPI0013FFB8C1|nr:FAD-dependent oxidoreductase [Rhodoferax sp.]NDP39398.1 FAD-binding oxidoreductase [Rhodoferax sp.]
MTQRDVLIIGGGIFGSAIAWALGRRGLGKRVLILEREQPASGATSRAAALVTMARDDPSLMALAGETFRAMAVLEGEYGEGIGRRTVGALHVVPTSDGDALKARVQHCASYGIASQWVDKPEALARAPWLAPQSFDLAAFYPDDCFVDPYLLSSAYLRTALQMGAQLRLDSNVLTIMRHAGGVTGVKLTDGTLLPASIVINAAGTWANLLSVGLGLPLPMAPVRSQYWITEPAPIFPRDGAIVLMPEIRAYARPEVGALLFGVREQQPAVVDPRQLPRDLAGFVFDSDDADGWKNLAEGAATLAPYFPALNTLGMAHYITGPSTYTPDGQLIIGASRAFAGLFVATGCNGSGITFSGGVGRLVAELVCGEPAFVTPEVFDPERYGDFDPYAMAFLKSCAAARAQKSAG